MREIIITLYLVGFKIIFNLCKLFPLKNKVVFLVSFAENQLYLYEQLKEEKLSVQTIFLCRQGCYQELKATGELTYLFETKQIGQTLKGIYHLATSKEIIVDNYYGFLATVKFKNSVRCTQIWHAAGAIKQFGMVDPTNKNRSSLALSRFKKVYQQFDCIVVGSEFMTTIYEQAFLAKSESFLRTGVPRTDFFFNEAQMTAVGESIYQDNPALKGKKVLLYAPTFRKGQDVVTELALDLAKMDEALKAEYVLILKLHPQVSYDIDFSQLYPGFVFDYGSYPNVNDLLVVTDILISDYSSIPMEFAFLGRQMIFYAYDLEAYKDSNGLWEDYIHSMPGPVVKTTAEVIEAILNDKVDHEKIIQFSKKWNAYSTGTASEQLVDYLFKN